MKLKDIFDLYEPGAEFSDLKSALENSKNKVIHANGLLGSSASLFAAMVYEQFEATQILICNTAEDARYLASDIENLVQGKTINYLPSSYKRSFQPETLSNQLVLERAEVLNRLNQNHTRPEWVITTAEAMSEWVISEQDLNQNTYELKVGDAFDLEFFMEFLTEHHFERSDFVYEAGQFSIRGGIVDVYSFSNEKPYRIELNGDTIEGIRIFEPYDQLSVKKVDRFFIIPNVQKDIQKKQRFFDYLPENTLFWVQDLGLGRDQIARGLEKAAKFDVKNYTGNEELNFEGVEQTWMSANDWKVALEKFKIIEFGPRKYLKASSSIGFQISLQPVFHKNFKLLIQNLKENTANGYQNFIFSESSRQIERLYTIFEDLDKEVKFEPIYHGLSNGFIDHQLKCAFYTEHQIFDRFYKGKVKSGYTGSKIITLKELRELRPGDYVTHIDHGIGKFAGLEKLEINGQLQEAVRLVYRDNDLLYVSINSLHKISKYVGKEGAEPRMNKLGSDAWEKLKSNTKKKVKDIARDLIKLYAKRKAQQGFAFSPDNYMQIELEASFMYEDTPDQSKATFDVKKDMENPHPMDRLICGDVGFGKTEIAIRAAFKSICDSKQVAILVPTTILANQHYRTFKERLKDFPCNIDYINRFKSAAEQKVVLKKLAEGQLDLVIGTHRLLSKDTKFKDLGLLIIDEEQKFGVAAKEKLKSFKTNVDTLTLTATPIPRTLHFSLMGARDLSIINTPPANRQPVETTLYNYNDEVIKEAILNEVERGGQVFFVHHRVKDIYDVGLHIEKICPGVKVAVAHGQLEGDHLEDVMMRFIEGEYDVLVATTIIEAGLDISNANTIIINNAHMFGLSDLHQMRGRVGRSNKKAFCYLLVPAMTGLSNDARKRLQAIEEFSDLGSGFNVAMRDLDIRGAGNLLGGEQSGFVAEIGFEMYHKILDEAIHELKEDEFAELFKDEKPVSKLESRDCNLETDLEALIPDNYVRNIGERLSLYNSLSALTKEEDLLKFGNELRDRFGKLPKEVLDLIDLIALREMGKKLGFEKLILKRKQLLAYFPAEQKQFYYQSELFTGILSYVQQHPKLCKLKQSNQNLILMIFEVNTIKQASYYLNELVKLTSLPDHSDRT
ncbi:MAG: transcription-repair coupling factor [Bacteroidetes bacterium B1(2017)]|nr:MAG: transcription-repair coupling factor [Bacteroidetes bacterium B1(2017)]